MFICLSSGASPRYRKDILLSIAMPKGSNLQFRYDLKWISQEARNSLCNDRSENMLCLIAYIDQSDETKTPEIIPCRFAKIKETKSHGTTTSLILELEDLAYAEDLINFNKNLRSKYKELPMWQNGAIRGFYWLKIKDEDVNILKSIDPGTWEKVITQLASHSDFSGESWFYLFQGLYPLRTKEPITHKDGKYVIKHRCEYEIQIYHYHPNKIPQNAGIILTSASQMLKFMENPLLILDSRYDLKRVHFKTGEPLGSEYVTLSILRTDDVKIDKSGYWEFDILLRIKGTFWKTLGYGIIIGILLAAPQISITLSNPTLKYQSIISIIQGLASLIVGILVAFGQKKLV